MAAAAERTIVIVETTEQAESVIAGERGIIKSARPGHIVLCMATIDPFAARALADTLAAQGIAMLDAPVSGGTGRAQSGELSVIVGGAADVVAKCEDLFSAMGNRTFHVGPLGNGLAMKLVNNMLVQVNTVAVAEALVLGVKAGLDPQMIYDVVRVSTGASAAWELRVPRILNDDFEPAARSTFPTRIRNWRLPSQSGWACRCCSRTSRSRSTRWRVPVASTSRTGRRSSKSSSRWRASP